MLTLPYTPYYCEENVWHLCQRPELEPFERRVVFVFAQSESCLLWQQQAAAPGQPVGWDYHVFLLVRDGPWQVWDLDTRLPLPVPWTTYYDATFGPTLALLAQAPPRIATAAWEPRFRMLPAERYVAEFASDRSHMRTPAGAWLKPPPPWPRIGTGHNLPRFLDPHDDHFGPLFRRQLPLD